MVDTLPCDEAVPFYESFPLEYTILTPSESNFVVPTDTIIYFEVSTNNRCNNDWYHNGVRKYTMNGVYCTKFGRNFGAETGVHTIKIDSYNQVNSLSHTWTITVVPVEEDNTNIDDTIIDDTDNIDTNQNESSRLLAVAALACGAFALIYMKKKDK